MTDRLTEIIAEALFQYLDDEDLRSTHTQAQAVAQRLRQAVKEEPVEALGLTRHYLIGFEDGTPLYTLPQEEGEKDA